MGEGARGDGRDAAEGEHSGGREREQGGEPARGTPHATAVAFGDGEQSVIHGEGNRGEGRKRASWRR